MQSINEIKLDGFQIVRSEMFVKRMTRYSEPTCSIRPNCIYFSKPALRALGNCDNIRIHVNAESKKLLAVPVSSTDRDAIRWSKHKGDVVESRKIECTPFSEELYKAWDFDRENAYRTVGNLYRIDGKIVLLFDFSQPESWKLKVKPEGGAGL